MKPCEEPLLRVLALGGGVQSTALALMAAHGEIGPMPDCAIFADTRAEAAATYAHLDWLRVVLPFPVHRIDGGDLRSDLIAGFDQMRPGRGYAAIPFFIDNGPGPKGRAQSSCTGRYKIEVTTQALRRMLGVAKGKNIAPNTVELWLGISTDEIYRLKDPATKWQTNRWPLIEQRMSRTDCIEWLRSHGYDVPVRSCCVFCPYRSDDDWRQLRANDFDGWQSAVTLDAELRRPELLARRKMKGTPFLHRSLKPLAEVELGAQPATFGEECNGVCGS